MRSLPHLLQRMRRWLALRQLQARVQQLQQLVAQTEAALLADHHELARLRARLASAQRRLLAARSAPPPRRPVRRIRQGD